MKYALLIALLGFSAISAFADNLLSDTFNSCYTKALNIDKISQIECLDVEYEYQDKRLNQNYKKLMQSLTTSEKTRLKKAQRQWLQYRDANLDFYANYSGFVDKNLLSSFKLTQETAKRANELEFILNYAKSNDD